ncbi:MAG: efflux RND transporter periplasmic adaptor subunit [Acidobacteriia bacterium]|nr:efflux RND transporter periplasmic adaptor subunit [Terriglobia bacterium]
MRIRQTILLGVAVCAATLGGWWYMHASTAKQYRTEAVQRGRIQSIVSVTGTVSALLTVQIGSQVSGVVTALHADYNSQVHKGELLAEIDPLPFQERVNQAQAALDSAKAAVDAAKATVQKSETDIRSAEATAASQKALVAQALAGEREAKIVADRQQKLAANSIVSDDQFQSAKATYDVAVADREASDAQAHVAETTIDEMKEAREAAKVQQANAEAQVRQAQGALDSAKLDLEHCRITSPIDGIVISRQVDAGQTVAASFAAPNLFQIAQDLTKMQVDADIDESEIAKVHVGQVAQFTVDAMPTRTFEAVVRQVRESATNVQNVITYDAVMDVPNPDLVLLPGMTANIRIPVQVRESVLRVPNGALRYKPADDKAGPVVKPLSQSQQKGPQTQQTVYVLNSAGLPEMRKIQVGISDGLYTEVVSGDLREGEAIVLQETHGK